MTLSSNHSFLQGHTVNHLDSNQVLVRQCLDGNRQAQRQLYDLYRAKMFAVCLRYASTREEAEDYLQEGFIQVFRDLHQYRSEGSLEGWIRRVIVRIALYHLKQARRLTFVELDEHGLGNLPDSSEYQEMDETMARHLLRLIQDLPPGFRTVLNLYIFERYTHKEIGETLGISEGTSKSQYLRAKEYLRRLLEKSLSL